MTARKEPDPVDRLLDVAVYAPLGLLLSARELLPEWSERGRRQLEARLPMARTVGEIAVRQGSKQARATLARLRQRADEILEDMRVDKGGSAASTTEAQGPSGPSERAEQGPSGPSERAEQGPSGPSERAEQGPSGPSERAEQGPSGPSERAEQGPSGPSPQSGELAIPGYDMLSASQVVQRLAGLSTDELEAVRAYELAGRARKTVLLRVAQLRVPS